MTNFIFLREKKRKKKGDPLTDAVLTQWAFLDMHNGVDETQDMV